MKLLILDRDGVINQESSEFVKSPAEWLPIKGSIEAISRLSQAGYYIVVITNQSGIGRELFSADKLSQIHLKMINEVQQHGGKIQSIFFCPHHPEDDCQCRKPRTGLYEQLAERLNVSFNKVYSVGDSLRDLQAAKSAGAIPVLVKTGNGSKTQRKIHYDDALNLGDTLVFKNLSKFTDALLYNEIK